MPMCNIRDYYWEEHDSNRATCLKRGDPALAVAAHSYEWPGLPLRVWTLIAKPLLEFLARADRLHINDTIDGENSIQVIDLTLQQFVEISLVFGIKLKNLAVKILIAHRNPSPPFHLHEDRKKTQARVPDHHLFFAGIDDLRIDQRPRLDTG